MDIREIIARLKNLEEQFINLSTKQGLDADASEKKDDSNAEKINEAKNNFKETSASIEEALCDIDIVASDRLADLEEALCELSEIMTEGGNDNG